MLEKINVYDMRMESWNKTKFIELLYDEELWVGTLDGKYFLESLKWWEFANCKPNKIFALTNSILK